MGEIFAGRYELVDVLDSGGVGTVWRAWDRREDTFVAAKVLRQSDGDSLLRFVRETSRRVEHPHVVTPLGWAGEDDRVLFTMPLVRGGSLATLLGDFGALPVGWVLELLRQTLTALAAVHRVGLVHRDVKPGNLLLDATGSGRPHLRLSDFGAAAQVAAPRLTRSDSVIGTPGYFAPEQIGGADPDPLQDVYAAGVVALQALTGQPPSSSGDLPTYRAGSEREPGLVDLLTEMTAQDPLGRPASAEASLERLAGVSGAGCFDPAAERAGGDRVEIFDHVPALPAGWTAHGPQGPDDGTGTPGPATAVRPSEAGTRVMPARTSPVPVAAWVLACLGVALIVAAAVISL